MSFEKLKSKGRTQDTPNLSLSAQDVKPLIYIYH